MAISSDGRFVVSGSRDKSIKIWNISTGIDVTTLAGHSDIVSTVRLSSDDKFIVSASWDSTIKIWNFDSG